MIILMAIAALQAQPASNEVEAAPIIVTGTRLSDDRDRLAECLRRNCPPLEDVTASLRYAENLFVAGEYGEARAVLHDAIDRNSRHRREIPRAVAGLYRAHARVSIHMGEGNSFRRSTFQIARTLADGLPPGSSEILLARLEAGDMHVGLGQGRLAEGVYETVLRQAEHNGHAELASLARLRLAWLRHLLGETRRSREILGDLMEGGEEESSVFRLAAAVMLARIARSEGDEAAVQTLIDELRRQPPQSGLTLLWAPGMDDVQPGGGERPVDYRLALSQLASTGFGGRWVDIGYWVRPDGSVAEAEILRSNGQVDWADSVLRAVGGRIYAPVDEDPASPGRYRIERFSYTALWATPPGSRIRQRLGPARIESLDLTMPDPAEPRAAGSPSG